MRVLFVLCSFFIELIAFKRWFSCWHFTDIFYYTPALLIDRVVNGINNDYGLPPLLTHVMHNKATYFIWGFLQTVMQYWDTRFLKEFIGIIGTIGIYLAVWYLLTKHRRNRYIWALFIFSILAACVEIFIAPDIKFFWKLLILGIPYLLLSLYGIWQFLGERRKSHYIFIMVILVLSLGTILSLPLVYQALCLKI